MQAASLQSLTLVLVKHVKAVDIFGDSVGGSRQETFILSLCMLFMFVFYCKLSPNYVLWQRTLQQWKGMLL